METTLNVGVMFTLKEGVNKRSFLYGYEAGLKAAFAHDPEKRDKPWTFISVTMHKGEHLQQYKDASEVPIVDVPCGCGDPNCWLIQWKTE